MLCETTRADLTQVSFMSLQTLAEGMATLEQP